MRSQPRQTYRQKQKQRRQLRQLEREKNRLFEEGQSLIKQGEVIGGRAIIRQAIYLQLTDLTQANPYDGYDAVIWLQTAHRLIAGRPLPTWRIGPNRKPKPITLDDVAVALFAIEQRGVSQWGLSYLQLSKAFQTATGAKCHRAKAAAILAALQTFGIIAKTAYEKRGKSGCKYVIRSENPNIPIPPPLPPKPKATPLDVAGAVVDVADEENPFDDFDGSERTDIFNIDDE